MSAQEIYEFIKDSHITNVTLTGGEPLIQDGIYDLLNILSEEEIHVEIETNGSVFIDDYRQGLKKSPSFTMDYKLPISHMEHNMNIDNFNYLTLKDTLKFVVGTYKDLEKMTYLVEKYELVSKTNVYVSPVFNEISYEEIVEYMKDKKLNGITFQIQLHKIIWDPQKRKV